jgi:hypothetical protein
MPPTYHTQTLSDERVLQEEVAATQEAAEERALINLQYEELRLREKSEFLQFRKKWSNYLLMLVVFIVVFNAVFLLAVGYGWIQFADEWLVRIIVGGSFIEVLGLAKIVVDFLFREPPM